MERVIPKRVGLFCVAIPTYVRAHRLKDADVALTNHAALMEYLAGLELSE